MSRPCWGSGLAVNRGRLSLRETRRLRSGGGRAQKAPHRPRIRPRIRPRRRPRASAFRRPVARHAVCRPPCPFLCRWHRRRVAPRTSNAAASRAPSAPSRPPAGVVALRSAKARTGRRELPVVGRPVSEPGPAGISRFARWPRPPRGCRARAGKRGAGPRRPPGPPRPRPQLLLGPGVRNR